MASTITERQRINTSSAVKVPCKAATTANVTLSGEQTIDGVACTTGDRVLVKNQTTASENGIWLVDTSLWKRSRDWDGAYDVKQGTFVYVTNGTNSGFWYVTTSTDPIIPGTTSVAIAQASSQLITFSAFAQLLLDDADATAMFNTLGISAYIQTLLNDADAATARTTLGAAADADVVHDTGNESVAGVKTFSDGVALGAATSSLKPLVKDHGTKSANYVLQLDEADTHLVAFSAAATLTIASANTNDKAIVIVKNGGFAITLAGIDNDSPTLTNAASTQDFLGLVKSFGKITATAWTLNKATV